MKKRLAILLLAGTFLGAGCGNSNDFVFTNTNNPGIAAPVCQDDAYTTNANTTLTVPAATGVLTNDTPNGATLTFSATSTQGGTITGAQDGSFVYVPPSGFSGADSFSYTLGNSGGVVTCTVTITVVAVNGFFVDAATGSDTTGSFTGGMPFATVQAAVAAASTNQDIVVRPGSYTGTVSLKNGQRLLGSGSTLITPQGVTRPVLTGPVVLADGNTLDFLRIAGTPGDAVDGNGQTGGTVTNCEIANLTNNGDGVGAEDISGTWNVSNNTISSAADIGVFITTTGTSIATATVNNNSITNCGLDAIGFTSANTSQCKAQVHGNTMTGNQANFTFEVSVTETAQFCLDLESNTNDDVYRFGIDDTGAVVNIEDLTTGPFAVAGNTGTFVVLSGAGFANPTSVANGFCGF